MAEQRPQNVTQAQDESIQAYLFGGLNTTATPLNTPFEDSPLLLNVDTTLEGSVAKRKGTRVLYESQNNNPLGVSVQNFSSTLNYNFTVVKNGTSLEVYEVRDDVATRVINKTNVFSSAAATSRPSTIRTSETEPRVLFFTGVNKPVQLRFVERQGTYTGSSITSVVFTEAEKYKNATPSNCLVFINRQRVTPTISYNAGTKELTVGIPSTSGTFVVDLILVTWQWWAEGMLWKGDRYSKAVTRFHVGKTDQNIAIPETLRTDLDAPILSTQNWEIFPYRLGTLVAGSAYCSAAVDRAPSGFDRFAFGDGAPYNYAESSPGNPTTFTNPTPFFITFGRQRQTTDVLDCTGAAISACTPTTSGGTICEAEPVYLLRRRELRLNNNEGISAANVDVYVNGSKRTQIISNSSPAQTPADYMRYWLFRRVLGGSGYFAQAITSLPDTAYYLSFEGVYSGLPGDARVEVINNNPTHIGSSAVGTRYDYNDGSYYPVYGIGLYADYKNGYYPSSVELYQGRLVLSGFTNSPLTAVFSNIYDSAVPGEFFNFFQVTDDLSGIATDPFDVTFNSRPDDKLIATVEYQSSLFALTRRSVFRVSGGNAGAVTISNHNVVFLSNIGCVNNASYTKTDKDVMYLSDTGVYNLAPQIENQEYQAGELTVKIRDQFGLTADPGYEGMPWLEFDDVKKLVYLGYPVQGDTSTNRRLFVYNTTRSSWVEYDTPGNFQTFSGAPYVDRTLGNGFLLALSTYRSGGAPLDFALVKLNHSKYVDFLRRSVSNGAQTDYLCPAQPEYSYTTSNGQHLYSIGKHEQGVSYPFATLPMIEVEDLVVTLNGVRLTNQLDYIKAPGGYIYLNVNPGAGKTLLIKPRRPVTDSEVGRTFYGVFAPIDVGYEVLIDDNIMQTSGYSVVTTSNRQYIRATRPNNAVIETAQAYYVYYSTPSFVNQTLRHLKQRKWVYAFFDNSIGQLLYKASDVNTGASQDPFELMDTVVTKVNANVSLVFNDENSGETSADLYGFQNIVWDDNLFDINSPQGSFQRFQLFKEPLRGTGYSYSMVIWSYDHAAFKLIGYQIDGATRGKRVKAKFQ